MRVVTGPRRVWWGLFQNHFVSDEGCSRKTSSLVRVGPGTRVVSDEGVPGTRRVWWGMFQEHVVSDKGCPRNTSCLMRVVPGTRRVWWGLFKEHVVSYEGCSRNTSCLMFQDDVVRTKLNIYVFNRILCFSMYFMFYYPLHDLTNLTWSYISLFVSLFQIHFPVKTGNLSGMAEICFVSLHIQLTCFIFSTLIVFSTIIYRQKCYRRFLKKKTFSDFGKFVKMIG